MESETYREMVFNYLDGSSSAIQKEEIDAWMKIPENQELFYKWLNEWEIYNLQYVSDVELGIQRHVVKMEEVLRNDSITNNSDKLKNETNRWAFFASKKIWLMAASLVLLCFALVGGLEKIIYKEYKTKALERMSFSLVDGTKVVLSGNSKLKVRRFGFEGNSRVVELEGRAKFDVVHEKSERSFIVKTNNGVDVVVLGTIFNVYSSSGATRVTLNEGSVKLNLKQGKDIKEMYMNPGETVEVSSEGDFSKNESLYKAIGATFQNVNTMSLNQTKLKDIAILIEEKFNVSVDIPDSLVANLTVSGTLGIGSVDELLHTLMEAGNLSVIKNDSASVTIKSN